MFMGMNMKWDEMSLHNKRNWEDLLREDLKSQSQV